jgi:uncharacterized integral membrane protein (TIGR00697 family)
MNQNNSYFPLITAAFVAVLIISNIASTKLVNFFGLTLDAGTILFPLSYIFSDILVEVYGYKKSRSVIWYGFGAILTMSVVFWIVGMLPASADWTNQSAYDAILGTTPFIVLGSIVAYLCGEYSNAIVMAKMKVYQQGTHLWMRTIGSTLVGELVDSTLFVLIAFSMFYPAPVLVSLIVANYVFKVAVEVIFTPVTYAIVHRLKSVEGVDVYDAHTPLL